MSGDAPRVKTEIDSPGSTSSGSKTPAPAARLQSLSATVKSTSSAPSTSGGVMRSRTFAPNLAMAGKRVDPAVVVNAPSAGNKRKQNNKKGPKPSASKKEKPKKEYVATRGVFSEGVKISEGKKPPPERIPRGAASGASFPGGPGKGAGGTGTGSRFGGEETAQASKVVPVTAITALNRDPTASDIDAVKRQLADSFISDIPKSDIAPAQLPFPPAPDDETRMETNSNILSVDIENGEFVFLQLPTILPELLADKKDPQEAPHNNPSDPPQPPATPSHPFEGVSPGRIGKLQRLRDGRLRLKLGNGLVIPLEEGMVTGFKQDVALVNKERLAVVGSVKQRYVGTPQIC